jgi:hypothetical protein
MIAFLSAAFATLFVFGLCIFASATEPDRRRTPRFDLTEKDPSLYHERHAAPQAQSSRSQHTTSSHAKWRTPRHGLRQSAASHS